MPEQGTVVLRAAASGLTGMVAIGCADCACCCCIGNTATAAEPAAELTAPRSLRDCGGSAECVVELCCVAELLPRTCPSSTIIAATTKKIEPIQLIASTQRHASTRRYANTRARRAKHMCFTENPTSRYEGNYPLKLIDGDTKSPRRNMGLTLTPTCLPRKSGNPIN